MVFARLIGSAIAIILLLAAAPARAGSSDFTFERFTVDNGLPENSVRAILEDSRGFLWFGTQSGLARYDGKEMVTRWHTSGDSTSAPRFMVMALLEDARGILWVGTALQGLWRLDPSSERFEQVTCRPAAPDSSARTDQEVLALARSADASVWVGWGRSGVCRHDLDARCVEQLGQGPPGQRGLPSNRVSALLEDAQGNLWVGTEDRGVAMRGPQAHTFDHFMHIPGNPTSLCDDLVNDFYEYPSGRIWVSTLHGLSSWSAAERRFRSYRPQTTDPGSQRDYLLQMASAADGGLWIGSAVGLYHFDPVTERFELYAHDAEDPESPVKGPVLSVLRDRSGIVWGGSWHAGLNKLDPERRKFQVAGHDPADPSSLDDDAVTAILEDSRGRLWVGTGTVSTGVTEGGLNRRDPGSGAFQHFAFPRAAGDRVRSVRGLCEDAQGGIWIGTNAGLWAFDAGASAPHPALPPGADDQGLRTAQLRGLFVDRAGDLWCSGQETGLYRVDSRSRAVRRYVHAPDDPHSISQDRLIFVFGDREGRVWVGSDTRGLNLYRPGSDDFQRYYDSAAGLVSVTDMHQDARGQLWLGSWDGLLRFDPRDGVVQAFTTTHGLPHDLVGSILEDEDGRLWLPTGRGVARLDPTSGTVRTFDVRDGLPSNEECFESARGSDGTLFLGGHHGLVSFKPAAIRDRTFVPALVLTDLRVADRPQRPGRGGPLPRAMPYTQQITLSHVQNDLAFAFAALDLTHPERNLYRHRLVGYHERWSAADHRTTATYTNLPAGRYRFEVEASNSDGAWSGASAALNVNIAPPWWLTTWARLLYAALAALIVYAIYRQVVHRERMRGALRLERAQAQQLQELDQFKSRFFANISHEFRTPLTLLQLSLQRLHEDPTGGDRVLFSMMSRNAKRLSELVDQLLDLARLEAGRLPLRWQNGDWLGFLRALVQSFESMATARGVTLGTDLPVAAESAWYDPDILEKIVGNLVSNAIRFTPDNGRVRVGVRLETRGGAAPVPQVGRAPAERGPIEAAASWLSVEVFNSGSYIPPAERARIFDRFEQTSADRDGHSGLGLALVKELVTWLHGSIAVQSDAGSGTTFRVALPLYHEPPVLGLGPVPDSQPGAGAPEPGEVGAGQGGAGRLGSHEREGEAAEDERPLILVVEDHADLRPYLAAGLGTTYRVLEAADGEAGLNQAVEEVPDLVLSDVVMPGMDGIELTRRLKADERTSHIPMILLTARAEIESRRQGLQTGADDYLAKPFDLEELRIRVANLIEQRRRLAKRSAQRVAWLAPEAMPVVSADEKFLARARKVIEEHLDDEHLDVQTLCREIGLSRAQLHRKLKALTGFSTREFVRTHRLRRAATLLEGGYGNVTEVAFAVGFSSSSYFAQCFREQYGVSPSEFRAKGRAREAAE